MNEPMSKILSEYLKSFEDSHPIVYSLAALLEDGRCNTNYNSDKISFSLSRVEDVIMLLCNEELKNILLFEYFAEDDPDIPQQIKILGKALSNPIKSSKLRIQKYESRRINNFNNNATKEYQKF